MSHKALVVFVGSLSLLAMFCLFVAGDSISQVGKDFTFGLLVLFTGIVVYASEEHRLRDSLNHPHTFAQWIAISMIPVGTILAFQAMFSAS